MKTQIDSIFSFYEAKEPLTVSFDYVRVRFKTTDYNHVIENILGMKVCYIYGEDYGRYRYTARLVYGNIIVMFNEEKTELGVLLEMSGRGCRQFEFILSKQNRSWFDFFDTVVKNKAFMKRLDLPVDDKVGILDVPTLIKKRENGEYRSHLKMARGQFSGDGEDYLGSTLDLGTRKGEIHALKWSGINGSLLNVKRSISQKLRGEDRETPPKNKSSIRTLQMPLPLIKVLEKHQKRQEQLLHFSDDYRVCGGEKCLRDSTIQKRNVRYAELAGLKNIRIHDYRHSHASLLAHMGINIQEIARRLGHSNVEETWNTYSHLYPYEEEKAINILNGIA